MRINKILLLIIIIAAFLRIFKLSSYPVSLSWDEVAIGYNAFSIAQAGTDEYGNKWPLLFKSFNDFKLPGYIYLDSLFIKIFGLSEFVTRFPSAFLGTTAVILVYLIAKFLFDNKVAIVSAFLLAISPWHLQLSRAAFESNASLTFILIGIALLFYGFKNRTYAFLSLPFISLSIYFYYSPRIFIAPILIVFVLIFKKQIYKNFRYYLLGLVTAVVISIPITVQIFSIQGFKRVKEVSIFEDKSLIEDYVQAKTNTSGIFSTVFLNRRIPLAFEAAHNYFLHFSPGFLFFGDDPNPRHRSSFHGNLYVFEIPLMVFGIWLLLKLKNQQTKYFTFAWLLLGPLSAAFAKDAPHSLRSLLMLPPLVMISSLALSTLYQKYLPRVILTVAIVLFFFNYIFSYYVVYPQRDNLSWAYGHKQLFEKISEIEDRYDRIVVSGHYWKPYIFYLFYNKINPLQYIYSGNQESIGKYKFGTTGWDSGGKDLDDRDLDRLKAGKTLVVLAPSEKNALGNKEKFLPLEVIRDFAGKEEIFIIGEWQ